MGLIGVDHGGDPPTSPGEVDRVVTRARSIDHIRQTGARIGHGQLSRVARYRRNRGDVQDIWRPLPSTAV